MTLSEIGGTAFLFIALLLLAYAITFMYIRYAKQRGVMDLPNDRSSHTIPTPRGGGLSVVIGFCLIWAWTLQTDHLSSNTFLALIVGCLPVAAIGFWDDHHPVSNRVRFSVHITSALAALFLLKQLPSLTFGSWHIPLSGLGIAFLTLACAWLLNLYNFMDGIDGIAAAEAITTLLSASLILWAHDEPHLFPLLLCAPLIGFALLNWPPAKVFMGDGCSGFLGICLALLAVIYASTSSANLWCWAILLGGFVVDASWTLITRISTGQKWHSPHRSHVYQILSRRWQSHAKVSSSLIAINILWLLPLAITASFFPSWGLLLVLISYTPLLLTCAKVQAGNPSA